MQWGYCWGQRYGMYVCCSSNTSTVSSRIHETENNKQHKCTTLMRPIAFIGPSHILVSFLCSALPSIVEAWQLQHQKSNPSNSGWCWTWCWARQKPKYSQGHLCMHVFNAMPIVRFVLLLSIWVCYCPNYFILWLQLRLPAPQEIWPSVCSLYCNY